MRQRIVWCLGLLLCVSPAASAEPEGKLVRESWDAAYLAGGKVGFYHTTTREIEQDGRTLLRTSVEMDLTLRRFGSAARLRMITATDETAEGAVVGVVMKQFLGNNQQSVVTSQVEGKRLRVRTEDGRIDKTIPWNDQVVGLGRQETYFRDRKDEVKPGAPFTWQSYEPTITYVVTVRATVKGEDETEVLGVKKRLLRVDARPDKLEVGSTSVQLPGMVVWLDSDFLPVRSQMEMPEIGTITLYRTTREVALAPGPAARVDIGPQTFIRLDRPIANPTAATSIVYRITLKDDDDPATAFARDDRQILSNVRGQTFDLEVRAVRSPEGKNGAAPPDKEYLESNYYLTADDARLRQYAERAVRGETDPWKKAQLIERWLHEHVLLDNGAPFVPAARVAATLRGDCRHKAILGAAMCRAVGIPSRTAVGLIYTMDRQRGPVMAFHMWVEVWVKGQWLALDGTLGLGFVAADHLKLADHSWHDTQSWTPMLPVARILGKVSIEVVRRNAE